MKSFKFEGGGTPKKQALSLGALLVIFSLFDLVLIGTGFWFVIGTIGLILLIGSIFASE